MPEWLIIAIIIIQAVLITYLLMNRSKSGNADLEKIVVELRESINDKLTERLDKNQDMMINSLQRSHEQSSKIISDVTAKLSEIKETNKQVISVTDELKTLQNILQNPKQRGVLGEFYLQTVLENVLPPDRFTLQYKFKDNTLVDAVIYLQDGKVLPIDSKFSLENYNRLIETKSKSEREKLLKAFRSDLKTRIDETSKYIRPDEDTMDFAFMFIPSEAIYYDLLINRIGELNSSRDLVEYAMREKKVVIVSPTSFMAYLQTVMQGLRSLQIEEKAKDIQKQVFKLGQHVTSYEDYMKKLGKAMGVSVSHYNRAYKELNKIDKDVMKIAATESTVEPEMLDKPQIDE